VKCLSSKRASPRADGFQMVFTIGLILFLASLLLVLLSKIRKVYDRNRQSIRRDFLQQASLRASTRDLAKIDVYLTAWNDQLSIGPVVQEFKSLELVDRVIVIDNDSTDQTREEALRAGAEVVVERNRGYGQVVYRALTEGSLGKHPWFAVCEGDGTFLARDLHKLMQYTQEASVVNGTRIVEQLREVETQLTNFMFFGNFFAAKILEVKHLGKGTFTDLGTTYKLVHAKTIGKNLHLFSPEVNLEFNAHFLDRCLSSNLRVVEVPINFRARIGESKGGNRSNLIAIRVGLKMLKGILFGWKFYGR